MRKLKRFKKSLDRTLKGKFEKFNEELIAKRMPEEYLFLKSGSLRMSSKYYHIRNCEIEMNPYSILSEMHLTITCDVERVEHLHSFLEQRRKKYNHG